MANPFEPTVDFGTDVSCGLDIDPMMRMVTGIQVLLDSIQRRFDCPKGGLLTDPLYGESLALMLADTVNPVSILKITEGKIRSQMLRDERVATVSFDPSNNFDRATSTLTIAGGGTTGAGPFSFVFTLTRDTVQVVLEPTQAT